MIDRRRSAAARRCCRCTCFGEARELLPIRDVQNRDDADPILVAAPLPRRRRRRNRSKSVAACDEQPLARRRRGRPPSGTQPVGISPRTASSPARRRRRRPRSRSATRWPRTACVRSALTVTAFGELPRSGSRPLGRLPTCSVSHDRVGRGVDRRHRVAVRVGHVDAVAAGTQSHAGRMEPDVRSS